MGKPALSAIVGLGFSALSRDPIGSERALAADAVRAAALDCGLALRDIDGLLLNASSLAAGDVLPLKTQHDLGLRDLRLLASLDAKGSSVVQLIQQASLAIANGMASTVACVFADAPLSGSGRGGASYDSASALTGIDGWEAGYGLFGPVGAYALAARRYMAVYGVTEQHLGAYAVACRRWAQLNPRAFLREPLTMETYLASRMIVEPFRLLDCAYPVNGGAAVIVTSIDRATALARPPVYVHGMGQGHAGAPAMRGYEPELATGGEAAGHSAYAMAGIHPRDVSACQFYDAFSYSALVALEDYGLCARGEAGAFVLEGRTAPGGTLPVNTGGGQLSGFYLQGMTPVSEAVIQARGEGGARQTARNDILLVNGSGGRLEYHAALVVSPHRILT